MSLSNSNKRRRVEPASFGKQQCPAPPPPTPLTTITITEEDVLRFQRQTDPSTWTLHRTLEMQRLHGPRVFGRALHCNNNVVTREKLDFSKKKHLC